MALERYQSPGQVQGPAGIIAQADVATRVNRDKTTGELVEAISESGTSRQ